MRILIVSYYFPPYMNVGGFRAMSWARRFHDRGHQVTVVCGDGQEADSCAYFTESLDRDIEVLRIHNPMLERAPEVGHKSPEPGFIDLVKDRLRPYLPVLDSYVVWAGAALAAIRDLTRARGEFHTVISTSFPLSAHEVAYRTARAGRTRWIADFRDFYGQFESNALVSGSPRERFLRARFRKYGRRIDLATTVSEPLRSLVSGALGRDAPDGTMLLYNGYFEEHLPESVPAAPRWRILYTGSYNATEFTLEPLVSALRGWPEGAGPVPGVAFTGSPSKPVTDAFGKIGIVPEFLGAVGNREALRLQADSAFLLICDSMTGPGALLTKTFEYLAARRPIICISRPGSDLRTGMFANAKPGYCASMDPGEIRDFMLRWRPGFVCARDLADAFLPPDAVRAYSREYQADRLVDWVESR